MYQIILTIHVLLALSLIILVLVQHGKGADIGAAFGSAASNTVFGSQGSGGFLFKLTGSIAMAFFVTSLSLSYIVATHNKPMILESPQAPISQVPLPESN